MTAVGLRFELFVDDIEEAARFFNAALGFVVPDGATFDQYLPITSGPVTLGINRYADLPHDHLLRGSSDDAQRGVGCEIVLEVNDVDAAYERARTHAVYIEPLMDRPWGLRDFRVVAPGGYYVRVTSVAP